MSIIRRWRVPVLITLAFVLLGAFTGVDGQQNASICPDNVVAQALAAVQTLCGTTGRNQICYGHDHLQVLPAELLATPGDIAPVDQIQALQLAGLDDQLQRWGVALAKLQVNLPDALPGENVTFVLYGDVDFTPLPGDAGAALRAFRLKTGITGVDCGATSMTGMLVQAPEASQRVSFTINGVEVKMGSTVRFTAQPGDRMTVQTLRGAAYLKANGRSSVAVAGTQVSVPMNEDLEPDGEPSLPEAYDLDELEFTPLDWFDEEVNIADPLPDDELADLQDLIDSGNAGDFDLDQWFDESDYATYLDETSAEAGTDASADENGDGAAVCDDSSGDNCEDTSFTDQSSVDDSGSDTSGDFTTDDGSGSGGDEAPPPDDGGGSGGDSGGDSGE